MNIFNLLHSDIENNGNGGGLIHDLIARINKFSEETQMEIDEVSISQ
jgi:hypothetical protein